MTTSRSSERASEGAATSAAPSEPRNFGGNGLGSIDDLSEQQRAIVLLLRERGTRGATSREFVTELEILNYTARMDELRNRFGFGITCEYVGQSERGRAVHRYTLVSDPLARPQGALFDAPIPTVEPVSAIGGLDAVA